MPRVCTICHNPARNEIDRALAVGESSVRGIAGRYGLARTSMARHMRSHLDPALIAALRPSLESREALAKEAIGHCRWLVAKAREQSEKVLARESQSEGVVCTLCGQRPSPFKDWIDPLNRAITSLGKFTGELANDQVNAMFINLGVRSEQELQRRLEVTKHGENLSLDEAFHDALDTLRMVLLREPERRQDALRRIEAFSGAEVLESSNGGNG